MSGNLSEHVLEIEAQLAQRYSESHSDMSGFPAWLATQRGDVLIAARDRKTLFDSKAAAAAKAAEAGAGETELNPWAKPTWNVTKQHEVMSGDPNRAKALMQAAGVRVPAQLDDAV